MSEEFNGLVIHDKPISELTLKKLLLVFDKIFLLHPEENKFLIPDKVASYSHNNVKLVLASYHPIYNGEYYCEDEEILISKFDYAYSKGIVNVLNLQARKFYQKNWLPLRLSFEYDISNPNILNLITPRIINDPDWSLLDGVISGGFISPRGVKVYPDVPKPISFFSDEENKEYLYDIQLYSTIGKVNRALAVCSEYDLIPIFINENLAAAFNEKFDLTKENEEKELKSKFNSFNNLELSNTQYLLLQIADSILDDSILNRISVKELIYARENSFHELSKLRRKLIHDINFIASTAYSDDFLIEVKKYINIKIEPQVLEYKTAFLSRFSKFIGHTGAATIAGAGTYFGAYQGLTPELIAYISGVSAVVGSVTSSLSSYVGNRKNTKFRNTFSYFLKLND